MIRLFIMALRGNMEMMWFDDFPGQNCNNHALHKSMAERGWAYREGLVISASSREDYEARAARASTGNPDRDRDIASRPYFIRLTRTASTPESRLRILMKCATVSCLPSCCYYLHVLFACLLPVHEWSKVLTSLLLLLQCY
jgi:hypothetical protein